MYDAPPFYIIHPPLFAREVYWIFLPFEALVLYIPFHPSLFVTQISCTFAAKWISLIEIKCILPHGRIERQH